MTRWIAHISFDDGQGGARMTTRVVEAVNKQDALRLAAQVAPAGGRDFVVTVTLESDEQFLGQVRADARGHALGRWRGFDPEGEGEF